MKRITTILCLILAGFFFGSCSDEGTGDVKNAYAKFMKTDFSIDAMGGEVVVNVEWVGTTWEIVPGGGAIVKSVTPQTGGGKDAKKQFTSVKISCNANSSMSARKQTVAIRTASGEMSGNLVLEQGAAFETVKLSVDPSVRYQPVVGFGGMYNPIIWCGGNLISDTELDRMYSKEGLGYSILRLMIYPNENDWNADVAAAKAAQAHGALVFACPWDCTDALSEQINVNGKQMKHLKKENYDAYADHIIRYINFMKDNGVYLHAVSVQNEPDMEFTYWYPNEVVEFVKEYGAKIRQTGVKLMSPEACGTQPEYTDPILNDAAAMAQTDIIAGHIYQGFIDLSSGYVKNRHDYICRLYSRLGGKTWWMTEHLFNDGEKSTNPADWEFQKWQYVLSHLGQEIHMCMEGYCSAYVYWYLKRFYGMMGDNDNRSPVAQGQIAKNGYILSHYAKYATGTVRIQAALDGGVGVTAYLNEKTGDISFVFLNLAGKEQWVEIPMAGIKEASAVETTEDKDMAAVQVRNSESGNGVYFRVAPESITSVKLSF